jgi:Fe-S oxidoreductase
LGNPVVEPEISSCQSLFDINQSTGWIINQPRQILRSFVKDFVEMQPNGRQNYCCGGGGGLVSLDETYEFRMEVAGKTKARQIQASGADMAAGSYSSLKLKKFRAYPHCQTT